MWFQGGLQEAKTAGRRSHFEGNCEIRVLFEDRYITIRRINNDDDQPLKRAISIPGLVNAFLMLGFTAFLQQYIILSKITKLQAYSSTSKAGGSGVSGRTK